MEKLMITVFNLLKKCTRFSCLNISIILDNVGYSSWMQLLLQNLLNSVSYLPKQCRCLWYLRVSQNGVRHLCLDTLVPFKNIYAWKLKFCINYEQTTGAGTHKRRGKPNSSKRLDLAMSLTSMFVYRGVDGINCSHFKNCWQWKGKSHLWAWSFGILLPKIKN